MLIALSVGCRGARDLRSRSALYLQRRRRSRRALRERFAAACTARCSNKYWVDELYDAIVVRPVMRGSRRGCGGSGTTKVVDGVVNGVGYTLEGVSAVLRLFQTGFVGTYALFITLGVVGAARSTS